MECNKNSSFLRLWNDTDGNECVVDFCKNLMDTARKESCGRDVLCREGTWQVYEIIKDISEGNSKPGDFELIKEILEHIKLYAGCEMSKTAANECLMLMNEYEEEWDQHIRRKRCSKLICKGSFQVYIDPLVCNGCGICLEKCPHGSITGSEGLIHVIDPVRCRKSQLCIDACPIDAIKKTGALLPKLPKEPVPVGSFGSEAEEPDGGRRRRQRRERA